MNIYNVNQQIINTWLINYKNLNNIKIKLKLFLK